MTPATPVQSSAAPTRKVLAAGVAGALTVLLVWAVQTFAHITIDPTVAGAITILLGVVVAYLVPPAPGDTLA